MFYRLKIISFILVDKRMRATFTGLIDAIFRMSLGFIIFNLWLLDKFIIEINAMQHRLVPSVPFLLQLFSSKH